MTNIFSIGKVFADLKTIYFRLTIRPSNDFDKNVIYKMVWDRRPILKILNNKTESLKYVKELIPDIRYPHRYYETSDIESINWNELPENFVCKMSHGSGGVILVHKNAPAENFLPKSPKKFGWNRFEITQEKLEVAELKNILRNLQKRTYGRGFNRSYPEWAYWGLSPKVIIEDFVKIRGSMPVRIGLNVVRGEVKLFYADHLFFPKLGVQIDLNERAYSDPINVNLIAQELGISKANVEELIQRSILIARDLDFLRVDWLLSDDGIYFNELANYCGGGRLNGKSYYSHMCQMWTPDRSDYR